mgnify:CR=1 FL=1
MLVVLGEGTSVRWWLSVTEGVAKGMVVLSWLIEVRVQQTDERKRKVFVRKCINISLKVDFVDIL